MTETDIDAIIGQQFNKQYCFKAINDNWILPPPNDLWTENEWSDETLLSMKDTLNSIKNLLNDKERGPWSEHTQSLNPAGSIVPNLKRRWKPELCTQAWAKCFEIMTKYEEYFFSNIYFDQLNTIHLCEAPGAFITALNHFIYSRWPGKQKDWKWIATTLNPYYEGNLQSCMINDDRFILNTLDNWEFGTDNTGDITHCGNLEKLELRAKELGNISLITADGSVGCHDNPSEQEDLVSFLHYCEVVTAFTLLKNDGNFVVKMFTFFECRSISLLYLLNCFFRDLHLYKPATSKEGNSEVYVICIGFKKELFKLYENDLKVLFDKDFLYYKKVLLQRKHIPQDFLEQVYESSKLLMQNQVTVIERNVLLYNNIDITKRQYYDELQSRCLYHYLNNCNIRPIDDCHLIVPRKQLKSRSPDLFLKALDVTYNSLQKRKIMLLQEKVLEMKMELDNFMPNKWIPENDIFTTISLSQTSWLGCEWHLNVEFVKCGKAFYKIQSSRFSCQFLINMWNELSEKIENPKRKSDCKVNFPFVSEIETSHSMKELVIDISNLEHSIILNEEFINLKIIHLRKTINIQKLDHLNIDNLLWIEALLFIKENVNGEGNIYILTENLMTRFTVGCFYILCHYFEEIKLFCQSSCAPHNQIICIKACKYKILNKSTHEFLRSIRKKLMTEETENVILEIVPVQQIICDAEFYDKLYDFNKRKLAQQLYFSFKEISST